MTTPVLIVGGGPAGATLALLLARHGVRATVVERRSDPQGHPAAHVLSTRTMEVFREIGIEREVRRLGARLHELRDIVYATSLTGPELGRIQILDPASDEADELEGLSPTRAAHLSQHRLEPLLWQRLRSEPRVEFLTGTEYLSHAETPVDVKVRLRDGDGERTLSCRYLIAADGAGSRVRRSLGIEMVGPVLQHVVSVYAKVDLRSQLWSRRAPVIWTHTAAGMATIIVHRAPDEVVFQFPYFPPAQRISDFDDSECRRLIVAALGRDDIPVEIKAVRGWAMTAQVATTYGRGRALLVGDAAHRFPPTGGLGLNTGVGDAHNLAWKLAWTLSGTDQSLVDTYEAERRPVAIANCDHSVANFEGLAEVLSRLGLRPTGRRLVQAIASFSALEKLPLRTHRRIVDALVSAGGRALGRIARPGAWGERRRKALAPIIAAQAAHYRTWGLDLGVVYQAGFVDQPVPAPQQVETYSPAAHVGGRLPHLWVERDNQRRSTLDLVDPHSLTLVAGHDESSHQWRARATAEGLAVATVDLSRAQAFADLAGRALLVRPDGHIAALVHPTGDDLRSTLERLWPGHGGTTRTASTEHSGGLTHRAS